MNHLMQRYVARISGADDKRYSKPGTTPPSSFGASVLLNTPKLKTISKKVPHIVKKQRICTPSLI